MRAASWLAVCCVSFLTACNAITLPTNDDPYSGLTEQDVSLAARLLQRTLDHAPDGTTRRWINDQSGHRGAITPVRSYIAETGQYCRDYREDLEVGGQKRNFLYSACRDEDRWSL